jgi:hypothetical protein
MPWAGFEPTIPASERPQTHALDRAATGIGEPHIHLTVISLYHHVITITNSFQTFYLFFWGKHEPVSVYRCSSSHSGNRFYLPLLCPTECTSAAAGRPTAPFSRSWI